MSALAIILTTAMAVPGTNFTLLLAKMLATSSPILLVYLGGMILSVVLWRRCPKASLLCLLGLGLLLLTTMMQLAMHFHIARSISDMDQIYMLMIATDVIGNIVRAVATALLLGAIFLGRKEMRKMRQENVTVDQAVPAKTASFKITQRRSGESFLPF